MTSKPLDDDVLAETLAASRNYNTIKEASQTFLMMISKQMKLLIIYRIDSRNDYSTNKQSTGFLSNFQVTSLLVLLL